MADQQLLQCMKCKTILVLPYNTGDEAKYAGCPDCHVTGTLVQRGIIHEHGHDYSR